MSDRFSPRDVFSFETKHVTVVRAEFSARSLASPTRPSTA